MVTIVRRLINQTALIFFSGVTIFSSFASAAPTELRTGSLVLSDLDKILLDQSETLKQEIKQALKEAKKDDVGCVAPIVFRSSSELHLSRIAPFTCFFADNKSLTIQAKNVAVLPNGTTIPLEQLIKRKNIPQGVAIQFELTDWKWTTNQ